jgi:hypothetical protein
MSPLERRGAFETSMKRLGTKKGMAAGLALLGMLPSQRAAADPSASDRSMATQLFKEGRTLLDTGRVAQACRKLEESQRLDPGGGTLLNVALCHEREGLTATAWVEFTEALGLAKRDDRPQRIEFARAHIAQLEPELSRLTIQVPAATDVPDLEIKRDGSVLGRAARDSPIPVDPGDHVIEASAPGKIAWRQSVVVGSHGDSKTVIVPALDEVPGDGAAVSPSPAASSGSAAGADDGARRANAAALRSSATPDKTTAPERSERPLGLTIGAWTAIGLGVAAAGVGTYFGLHAMALKNDADNACPNNACTAQGSSQTSDAIRSGDAATVAFSVAAGGIVVGAVLLLVSHPSSHASSSASASGLRATSFGFSLASGSRQVALSGQW